MDTYLAKLLTPPEIAMLIDRGMAAAELPLCVEDRQAKLVEAQAIRARRFAEEGPRQPTKKVA